MDCQPVPTVSLADLDSSLSTHEDNAFCCLLAQSSKPIIDTITPPPITATSRQIREETLSLFYSDGIVELHVPTPNHQHLDMSSGAGGKLYYQPTLDLFEHFQRNDPKLHYALPFLLRQLAPLLESYGYTNNNDKQPLLECTQNTLIDSSAALEPEWYEKYGDMGFKCSYVLNKIPWPKDDKAAEEVVGAYSEETNGAAEEEEDKADIKESARKVDGVTEEEDEVDENESAEEDEALFE
ncbi:hypothetical protein LTR56_021681 [Elasticomyces elasticus]|nr:hypothetical protein LTR56_021681 [Elasticomyces elasticus]KAK3664838.1 hypothetical protein LTR22_004428 [Elasticomyces elasticus]KAK5765217.1 hypothetical protein LTS12_004731 [Elasticomyces elasticus]